MTEKQLRYLQGLLASLDKKAASGDQNADLLAHVIRAGMRLGDGRCQTVAVTDGNKTAVTPGNGNSGNKQDMAAYRAKKAESMRRLRARRKELSR